VSYSPPPLRKVCREPLLDVVLKESLQIEGFWKIASSISSERELWNSANSQQHLLRLEDKFEQTVLNGSLGRSLKVYEQPVTFSVYSPKRER
jgi:hypothetical protein